MEEFIDPYPQLFIVSFSVPGRGCDPLPWMSCVDSGAGGRAVSLHTTKQLSLKLILQYRHRGGDSFLLQKPCLFYQNAL